MGRYLCDTSCLAAGMSSTSERLRSLTAGHATATIFRVQAIRWLSPMQF